MLDKIQIDEYRGIKNLKINVLRRINLITGDNNSGKTSLLAAIQERQEEIDNIPIVFFTDCNDSFSRCNIPTFQENDKRLCLKTLQLFDPEIEEFSASEVRENSYVKHKKQGNIPLNLCGKGLQKYWNLFIAVLQAKNGILLLNDIENGIHPSRYDSCFSTIVSLCFGYNIQAFITTNSLAIVDSMLATQRYDRQTEKDDITVTTLKNTGDRTYTRVLTGRQVDEYRKAFDFNPLL